MVVLLLLFHIIGFHFSDYRSNSNHQVSSRSRDFRELECNFEFFS